MSRNLLPRDNREVDPTTSGAYIVGEGNDATGKSTQIDMLADFISGQLGIQTYTMHEPDGAPIASEIRTIIKNGNLARRPLTNLLLFTASRYETWNSEALPTLANGGVVLSARNSLSSEIYQGVAEGMGADYVRQVTASFMDRRYTHPDLVAIFALDKATRLQRMASRGEPENPDTFESRDDNFQSLIDQGYDDLAQSNGYPVIDASQTPEQIQAKFRRLAMGVLAAKQLI